MFSISFWSINSPQEMMLHFQWKLSKRSQRTTVLRRPMKTECFLSQMTMKNGCCSSRCFKWCHWRLRAFSPVFNDNEKQSMLIGMILFMSQKTRGNKTVAHIARWLTPPHSVIFVFQLGQASDHESRGKYFTENITVRVGLWSMAWFLYSTSADQLQPSML